MMLSQLDMGSALEIFVVSNTPLFLLRKLKTLPVISDIQKHPGREILLALRKSLAKNPVILDDYVLPYLYVIAIAGKGDASILQQAASLRASRHDWYATIADALMKEFRVTSIDNFQFPNVIPQSALIPKSDLPFSISTLEVNKT